MFNLLAQWYLSILLSLIISSTSYSQTIRGFTEENSRQQTLVEELFQTLPDGLTFQTHLQELTKAPHPAGSERSQEVIEYIAAMMRNAGLQVETYDYDIYLDHPPTDTRIEIVRPIRIPLNNKEYIHDEDTFSAHEAISPGWNAYSGSGDVTAEVVYVNYGRKEDFEQLEAMGISLIGKIALARYGGNFRGYKVKYAEAAEAAGVIIYTDPADNGYSRGLVYPDGNFADESTIQRGSVLTLDYTGDPLTPFTPALPLNGKTKAERLDPDEIAFHTIPVAPIPYGSAQEIMKRMTGQPVPAGWQGGLPFTYRIEGGQKLKVRLKVRQKKEFTRVTNVVGTLTGSEYPDEWIILGCHHDAWEFGALDPNSGTATLLTMAEALGKLIEAGYPPKRTIKIAHWDAEEFGILGSTEWVEQFGTELAEKTIAYINLDAAVSGPNFGASSSPSLKQLIIESTKDVMHPDTQQPIYNHWMGQQPGMIEPILGNLGGGSDHVGFYTHLGIPSVGLGMSRLSGIYHSAYDNFTWYQKFADPNFVYGPTMAKLCGIITLRLANAELIPYEVMCYATDLQKHTTNLEQRIHAYAEDFQLEKMRQSIDTLMDACKHYQDAWINKLEEESIEKTFAAVTNKQLIGLEKSFIREKGMPFGNWYRSLYASPDPFSGYTSWMLPALQYEASLQSTENLKAWEQEYATAIENLTAQINALTQKLLIPGSGK